MVDDCRSTIGKPALGHDPSPAFKKRILIAEHSPIRDISFRWRWEGIKSWIATHWVRHHWKCRVTSQRPDRTGIDRDKLPQDAPVDFTGEANTQHLIDTMRKRLCYKASPETRRYAEDLKISVTEIEPEIGNVMVPNCVYRGGCPEMKPCGYYERLCNQSELIHSQNIQQRYDEYNRLFEQEEQHGQS